MTNPMRLKHIHEPLEDDDGARILVDRDWPPGMRRVDARLAWWAKEVAPSHELYKWFGQNPDHWAEFRHGYRDELAEVPETLSRLLDYCRQGPVTLVFDDEDRERNPAVVLMEVLLMEVAEEETPNENASPVCYGEAFLDDSYHS